MATGTSSLTATGIKGVQVLAPRASVWHRRAVLALTILPFLAFVGAIASLWGRGLGFTELAIFGVLYLFTGFGITVGFHRLLTHRSFDAPRWVRLTFAVAASMAVEGSVITWVADHRRHHAYADRPGDPHSPHLVEGDGFRAVVKGLWHAHMGWLFRHDKTSVERWAPDLLKDPGFVRVDRLFPVLIIATFALPALLGFAFTRTLEGTLASLLWGGGVRVFLLHHVTWSVNSICHFYGKKPFATTDESTNNWPLSVISFGESWHNTHHAFPTSAVHGIERWQPDPGAAVIALLERLGLASNVKRVSRRQLVAKVDDNHAQISL